MVWDPTTPAFFFGKRSAQGAQRPEARGIPARRDETAQRARQGSPVAKRRAQPLLCETSRPQLNKGWVRSRCSVTSRICERSLTRTQPRGSSSSKIRKTRAPGLRMSSWA